MDTDKARAYKEINALTQQIRELQSKFDNQAILLTQTEDELREVRNAYRRDRAQSATAASIGDGDAKREMVRLQQVKNDLSAKNAQLEHEKARLGDDVKQLDTQLKEVDAELLKKDMELSELQRHLGTAKSLAARYEREARDLKVAAKQHEARESELQATLDSKNDMLGSLEVEAKMLGKHKADMDNARRTTNRLRKQLLVMAEDTNRRQNEMQNALQSQKALLEEIKVEYEEHAETVRLEWDADKQARIEQFQRLKTEFDNFKLMQFEDKQQLLREQQEVVKALQTQFEEYRQTAELLFSTEAAKLEDKLNTQMLKYEQEIRYIIKAKDQHYDEMMTAKDAKIMNLIEGTDFQALLIKHEMELEQLRRKHVDDLENIRTLTEAEQKKVISDLHKEIASQELATEKLKNHVLTMEEQLRSANEKIALKATQLAQSEIAHTDELKEFNHQLQLAHEESEKVKQEKADLRHRMIRMSYKNKGEEDETLPNLVKRLTLQTESLQGSFKALAQKYEHVSDENTRLLRTQAAYRKKESAAETTIKRQADEVHRLVTTFEAYLLHRATRLADHRGVAPSDGTKRESHGIIPAPESPSEGGRGGALAAGSSTPDSGGGPTMHFAQAIALLQGLMLEDGDADEADDSSVSTSSDAVSAADAATSVDGVQDSNAAMASKRKRRQRKPRFKATVPRKLHRVHALLSSGEGSTILDKSELLELARGIKYLNKFKSLTRAFKDGELNASRSRGATTNRHRELNYAEEGVVGLEDQHMELWDRNSELYTRLERAEADLSASNQHLYSAGRGGGDLNRVHVAQAYTSPRSLGGGERTTLGVREWTPHGLEREDPASKRGARQEDYAYRARAPRVGTGGFPLGLAQRSRTEPRPPRRERSPPRSLHSRD